MALFLVQHGIALDKQVDPERPLSETGKHEVEHIAALAKQYAISIDCIQHSGKTRAQQTANIFATTLNLVENTKAVSGLQSLDDVETFATSIDDNKNIMLVGHLPFMEKLAAYLITDSVDNPVVKFQNGGIICLDKEPESSVWFIKWTLLPHITA